MINPSKERDRVVLVHIQFRDPSLSADFREFKELALSAGSEIVGTVTGTRDAPDAKYFIGSGKVEETKALVAANKADLALFNHELTPTQERNLEKAFQCRVLGRTGLILDIFASRARTYEGKLQVELAQLQHLATRLVRGWTHLERQKGGIGLRGPGETQLEVDRRLIRKRIEHIQDRLEKVRTQREQGRRARQKAKLPTISLVGYTNVGKSTLFNKLTGAEVFVANQLFATLDPTLRALQIPGVGKVILADTVGFIRHLPHELVDAFRATLEETVDADLLLHVIDIHDEFWAVHKEQVEEVLKEIGALEVPRIEVYNKIDLLSDLTPHCEHDFENKRNRVYLSAEAGIGFEFLMQAIRDALGEEMMMSTLSLPLHAAQLRAALYEAGAVLSEREVGVSDGDGSDDQHWDLEISIPKHKWDKLCSKYPDILKGIRSDLSA